MHEFVPASHLAADTTTAMDGGLLLAYQLSLGPYVELPTLAISVTIFQRYHDRSAVFTALLTCTVVLPMYI